MISLGLNVIATQLALFVSEMTTASPTALQMILIIGILNWFIIFYSERLIEILKLKQQHLRLSNLGYISRCCCWFILRIKNSIYFKTLKPGITEFKNLKYGPIQIYKTTKIKCCPSVFYSDHGECKMQ